MNMKFVHLRGKALSKREHEVLVYASQGLTDKEIGRHIFVCVTSVKRYKATLLAKLEASNTAHAVGIAYRRGILTVEEPS